MPWVEFTADFDWSPIPHVTTAYTKGMRLLVTQPCSKRAIELGRAVKVATPKAAHRAAFEIRDPSAREE
jgi:hypothetical protein